ncbi:MAG: hypothetical protein JXR00_19425 [Sulfitobacter geojensis]
MIAQTVLDDLFKAFGQIGELDPARPVMTVYAIVGRHGVTQDKTQIIVRTGDRVQSHKIILIGFDPTGQFRLKLDHSFHPRKRIDFMVFAWGVATQSGLPISE